MLGTMTASRARELHSRAEAAQEQARTVIESAQRISDETELNRRGPRGTETPDRRQLLYDVPYARLLARLETMPAIEQAKGVVMAQSGCTSDEAFGLLRRASQRSNVPVRELAARIVANAGRGAPLT